MISCGLRYAKKYKEYSLRQVESGLCRFIVAQTAFSFAHGPMHVY